MKKWEYKSTLFGLTYLLGKSTTEVFVTYGTLGFFRRPMLLRIPVFTIMVFMRLKHRSKKKEELENIMSDFGDEKGLESFPFVSG